MLPPSLITFPPRALPELPVEASPPDPEPRPLASPPVASPVMVLPPVPPWAKTTVSSDVQHKERKWETDLNHPSY